MSKKMYSWWSKYMFWSQKNSFPFPSFLNLDKRLIVGHRGFSSHYPENTILAFDESINAGGKGIEMDIRSTSDGQFVVIHDPTVDRTTNGTGEVSNLTWDYIQSLDAGSWMDEQFANRNDTKIPTLEQVLDTYRNQDVFIILHLQVSEQQAIEILNIVESKNQMEQVIFFDTRMLIRAVKQVNPNAITLTGGQPRQEDYLDFLNDAFEYGHDIVSVHASHSEQYMIDAIHEAGKPVLASYLNTSFTFRAGVLMDMGVDMILTDNVLETMNTLNGRGLEQADKLEQITLKYKSQ